MYSSVSTAVEFTSKTLLEVASCASAPNRAPAGWICTHASSIARSVGTLSPASPALSPTEATVP